MLDHQCTGIIMTQWCKLTWCPHLASHYQGWARHSAPAARTPSSRCPWSWRPPAHSTITLLSSLAQSRSCEWKYSFHLKLVHCLVDELLFRPGHDDFSAVVVVGCGPGDKARCVEVGGQVRQVSALANNWANNSHSTVCTLHTSLRPPRPAAGSKQAAQSHNQDNKLGQLQLNVLFYSGKQTILFISCKLFCGGWKVPGKIVWIAAARPAQQWVATAPIVNSIWSK